MNTRDLCVTAALTAALTGGKTALTFLPNIEIVTLLLIIYALVLGLKRSLIICIAFVLIDCFIWGFGSWVILYFIHWPLMVVAVALLPKFKFRIPAAIVIGITFTATFGVLSTFIEIIFMGAVGSPYFWQYFYFRYAAGISFFLINIISNSIILPLLIPVLYKLLKKICKLGKDLPQKLDL